MQKIKTKFHPILFSTPMVQALLENRKTMTRRTKGLENFNKSPHKWIYDGIDEENEGSYYMEMIDNSENPLEHYKEVVPAYNVGDVLWVRENFYTASNFDYLKPSALKSVNVEVFYVADLSNYDISSSLSKGKTRPCIFLPKEYARIFLRIKSIKVERLQDISDEDAKKEGVESRNGRWKDYLITQEPVFNKKTPTRSFNSLWSRINGSESFLSNPLVFVYEFEKIEKPLNFI